MHTHKQNILIVFTFRFRALAIADDHFPHSILSNFLPHLCFSLSPSAWLHISRLLDLLNNFSLSNLICHEDTYTYILFVNTRAHRIHLLVREENECLLLLNTFFWQKRCDAVLNPWNVADEPLPTMFLESLTANVISRMSSGCYTSEVPSPDLRALVYM